MYTRTLLLRRYSRLAALYAILQIGRQPSFGGGGLATAKMQASNDPVITNATSKQLWTFVALYYAANSSSSAFASFRSRVSKPSVNHPYAGQQFALGRAVSKSVRH